MTLLGSLLQGSPSCAVVLATLVLFLLIFLAVVLRGGRLAGGDASGRFCCCGAPDLGLLLLVEEEAFLVLVFVDCDGVAAFVFVAAESRQHMHTLTCA